MEMALGSYENKDWLPVVVLQTLSKGSEVSLSLSLSRARARSLALSRSLMVLRTVFKGAQV